MRTDTTFAGPVGVRPGVYQVEIPKDFPAALQRLHALHGVATGLILLMVRPGRREEDQAALLGELDRCPLRVLYYERDGRQVSEITMGEGGPRFQFAVLVSRAPKVSQ